MCVSHKQFCKFIPLPVVTARCRYKCCERRYIPLDLSFVRTIHKFQGLSAGPVDEGKIPNMHECIVIDPDNKTAEGQCPGLFYTGISRGTTLGDSNGLHSAIYFQGDHITKERVQLLTKQTNSTKDYLTVERRRSWVAHLDKHCQKNLGSNTATVKKTVQWSKTTKYSYDELHKRVEQYTTSFRSKNKRKQSKISRPRKRAKK